MAKRVYYLDVVPLVQGIDGGTYELGAVRYEVDSDMIGDLGPMPRQYVLVTPPPTQIPSMPYSTHITYQCRLSWAGMPQPKLPKERVEE